MGIDDYGINWESILSDFTGFSPGNSRKMGLNSQKTRKNLLLKKRNRDCNMA
jgi:hypothetical protein